MADQVYNETTAQNPKTSCFVVPSKLLDKTRFALKTGEVLLSFVAFILEEVVNSCISCGALYFFEFVSCTAFLFTLLLLILLSTTLQEKVGISCWPSLDFCYTAGISVMFLISSIVFAADNGDTTVERAAVAFGFIATVLFVVDLVFFYKTYGIPFKKDKKADTSNGAVPSPQPEAQGLTASTEN